MIKLTAIGVMVFALSFFAVAITHGQTATPTVTPTPTTITATPTTTGAVQGTTTTVPDAAPATGHAGL